MSTSKTSEIIRSPTDSVCRISSLCAYLSSRGSPGRAKSYTLRVVLLQISKFACFNNSNISPEVNAMVNFVRYCLPVVAGRLDNMGRSVTTLRQPKSIPNNQYQQRHLHFETKRGKLKTLIIKDQYAEGLKREKPQILRIMQDSVTR